MSKRRVASCCQEVVGVPLAVGESCRIEQTVTQAVTPAVEAAQGYVQPHDTTVEETPWGEHQHRRGWWTVVTAQGGCLRLPPHGAPRW